MGNIDEKRLSGLLERIISIKEELGALENEVRGILTADSVTEPVAVTEPVEVTGQDILDASNASTSSATKATEAPETEETPIDDTPIDIDFANIDLPPIIEDPAEGYAASVASATEPSMPVTEPVEVTGQNPPVTVVRQAHQPVTEPVEVTDPVEMAESVAVTEPVAVTEETEPKDVQDIPDTEKDQDASGASTSSATKDIEADTKPEPKPENNDLPFDDDLPMDFQEQEPQPIPEPKPVKVAKPKAAILDSSKAETAVMDVMAEKQAWRTDRPGSQVKNVISAISLNDRVLLINVLFREDPILFQNTINAFNGMSSLDEAISYIQTNFPDWDMNSEPVYRLMMAVRRKLS